MEAQQPQYPDIPLDRVAQRCRRPNNLHLAVELLAKDIQFLKKFNCDAPSLKAATKVLEYQRRTIEQHETYLRDILPKSLETLSGWMDDAKKDRRAMQELRHTVAHPIQQITGVSSYTAWDRWKNANAISPRESYQRMEEPQWSRRWSVWNEATWKKVGEKKCVEDSPEAKIMLGVAQQYGEPGAAIPTSLAETMQELHTKGFTDTTHCFSFPVEPKKEDFTRYRTRRYNYGRKSQTSLDQGLPIDPITGQYDFPWFDPTTPTKTVAHKRATLEDLDHLVKEDKEDGTNEFCKAIDSDVETDVECIPDRGVDTDTDDEGRPATRCTIYDPYDGLPHPFWGVEVEQSSWVSIPNPLKLDPECKVLRLYSSLKAEARPNYNSVLLVRHYKPFLKFGMFPHTLFELWGGDSQKHRAYLSSELKQRRLLEGIERCAHPSESMSEQKKEEEEENIIDEKASTEQLDAADVEWIRHEVIRFQDHLKKGLENVHQNASLKKQPSCNPLSLPCPVDPTWRNVYSSRLLILKRPKKLSREELSRLHTEGGTTKLETTPDKQKKRATTRRPASRCYTEESPDLDHSKSEKRSKRLADADNLKKKMIIPLHPPHETCPKVVEDNHRPLWNDNVLLSHRRTRSYVTFDEYEKKNRSESYYDFLRDGEQRVSSIDCKLPETHAAAAAIRRVPTDLTVIKRHYGLRKIGFESSTDMLNHHHGVYPLGIDLALASTDSSLSKNTTIDTKWNEAFAWHDSKEPTTTTDLLATASSSGEEQVVDIKLPRHKSFDDIMLPSFPTSSNSSSEDHEGDATPIPAKSQEEKKRQTEALLRRTENRKKLKLRKGRRFTTSEEQVVVEGTAWLHFHQKRDLRTFENWPDPLPPPAPVPASICADGGRRSELSAHAIFPTFVPNLFRGPAQYEDLQETFLHILWSMRKSRRSMPNPIKKDLKLWIGGYMIPHDDKRFRYGDDSWFASEPLECFGVCDGVGEMSDAQWRMGGFDCRGFGEDILRGAKARFETIRTADKLETCTRPRLLVSIGGARSDRDWHAQPYMLCPIHGSPAYMSLDAMTAGYFGKTTTWGAATCLLGCLNKAGTKIGFANIGDSRAMVLRRGQYSTGPLKIVGTTEAEQHGWNLPVQLARLPDRSRVEMMRKDVRLKDLVRILDSSRATGQDVNDQPETATLFEIDLQEGDLIVVATDGLWDNLFDSEVAALCGIALSPRESEWVTGTVFMSTAARDIAKGLCLAAYWRSLQNDITTPFTESVKEAGGGGFELGGKPDDISVVCAWVVPPKLKNDSALLETCQREHVKIMMHSKIPLSFSAHPSEAKFSAKSDTLGPSQPVAVPPAPGSTGEFSNEAKSQKKFRNKSKQRRRN